MRTSNAAKPATAETVNGLRDDRLGGAIDETNSAPFDGGQAFLCSLPATAKPVSAARKIASRGDAAGKLRVDALSRRRRRQALRRTRSKINSGRHPYRGGTSAAADPPAVTAFAKGDGGDCLTWRQDVRQYRDIRRHVCLPCVDGNDARCGAARRSIAPSGLIAWEQNPQIPSAAVPFQRSPHDDDAQKGMGRAAIPIEGRRVPLGLRLCLPVKREEEATEDRRGRRQQKAREKAHRDF